MNPDHLTRFWDGRISYGAEYTEKDLRVEFKDRGAEVLCHRVNAALHRACMLIESDSDEFALGCMEIGG